MQALLSVFDKTGIVELGQNLARDGFTLVSTGGTSKKLAEASLPVKQVADITNYPELLGGRVKTLHPNIHGALLAKTSNSSHQEDLKKHNITPIQLVAVNLYPFEKTVANPDVTMEDALENIDIGGVTLLRAAAKNYHDVVVVCNPEDYGWVCDRINKSGISSITELERQQLAYKAFEHTRNYDTAISDFLKHARVKKTYQHSFDLKYGCNPHQKPAAVYQIAGRSLPFKVLNGKPGYINLMDALNAWQLVKELRIATGLPAATSFKHVSPAGAAVAVPLSDEEKEVYEIAADKKLTPQATAYIRARQADPMSSFGDFAALSDRVDEETALALKTEVSDGIIAPGFDAKAFEILSAKKGGNYIIIEADPTYEAPDMEFRELYGVVMSQKRNQTILKPENLEERPTANKDLPKSAIIDLLVANITLKYTQSNSVGYALNGQMIGVGAGQQSRVDCAKLAGRKARLWRLRFHPAVRGLQFKKGCKRTERTNARVHFIDGDVSADQHLFEQSPQYISQQDQDEFLKALKGVSLGSDAFFPFRDGIDVAAKHGVSYIAQPGGSVADANVIKACDEYNMCMAMTGVRLFHH